MHNTWPPMPSFSIEVVNRGLVSRPLDRCWTSHYFPVLNRPLRFRYVLYNFVLTDKLPSLSHAPCLSLKISPASIMWSFPKPFSPSDLLLLLLFLLLVSSTARIRDRMIYSGLPTPERNITIKEGEESFHDLDGESFVIFI